MGPLIVIRKTSFSSYAEEGKVKQEREKIISNSKTDILFVNITEISFPGNF